MKQHITPADLAQLNVNGKALGKLFNWWNNKLFASEKDALYDHPSLSIGDMIEFLYENREDKRYKAIFPPGVGYDGEIYPEKWCDELWEEVKEVLESK